MSVFARLSADGRELTLVVQGRFDYSLHMDFRRSWQQAPGTPERYCVDLEGSDYLDSSALGMLLLLRDHAGGDRARVRLRHCSPDVRRILRIAAFDQLFEID